MTFNTKDKLKTHSRWTFAKEFDHLDSANVHIFLMWNNHSKIVLIGVN